MTRCFGTCCFIRQIGSGCETVSFPFWRATLSRPLVCSCRCWRSGRPRESYRSPGAPGSVRRPLSDSRRQSPAARKRGEDTTSHIPMDQYGLEKHSWPLTPTWQTAFFRWAAKVRNAQTGGEQGAAGEVEAIGDEQHGFLQTVSEGRAITPQILQRMA